MNSFLDSLKISIELHGIIDSKIQAAEKYLKPERKNESSQTELQKQRLIQLQKVSSVLTRIIQILNSILCEYVEHECLSLNYLQKFHVSIQNRVEIIYRSFQQLERFEVYREVIMMQNAQANSQGFLALFGYSSGDTDSFNVELLKEVDRLMRAVPFQI